MANKTYLELVNETLVRLREPEVTAVTDNAYSKLIGRFINDAKRQVEDSYTWNALSETLTVSTSANLFNYVLTGIGQRFKVIDVINSQSDWFLNYETTRKMDELFLNSGTVLVGAPDRYNFNGVDNNGDTQVDLYPIPDGVYDIYFNVIKPQAEFTSASTQIKVPSEPVIFLAYAKALNERGEDNGLNSVEAYELYRQSLSDHIAAEANRYPEELIWGST
jgi:hypothetical protein